MLKVFPCFSLFDLLAPPGVFGLAPSALEGVWSSRTLSLESLFFPSSILLISSDEVFCRELLLILVDVFDLCWERLYAPFIVIFDNPEETDLEDRINDERVGCMGGAGYLLCALVEGVDCRWLG